MDSHRGSVLFLWRLFRQGALTSEIKYHPSLKQTPQGNIGCDTIQWAFSSLGCHLVLKPSSSCWHQRMKWSKVPRSVFFNFTRECPAGCWVKSWWALWMSSAKKIKVSKPSIYLPHRFLQCINGVLFPIRMLPNLTGSPTLPWTFLPLLPVLRSLGRLAGGGRSLSSAPVQWPPDHGWRWRRWGEWGTGSLAQSNIL